MPGPRLPPEISDCIIDLLSKEREVLKRCCLVSKSWVPRTRRYLFGWVEFVNPDDIDAWKETFPDPDNSPACHTHSLFVNCVEFITAAIVEEGSWMRAFHNVWRLEIFNGAKNMCIPPVDSPLLTRTYLRRVHIPFALGIYDTYLFPAPP